MSKAQKIFSAILAFLVIVLVFIEVYPNFHEGGNKSIFAESDSTKIQHDVEEQKKDEGHGGAMVTPEKKSDIQYTFEFTAFKTPEKVGVPGTFNDIQLSNTQKSDSLTKTLTGAQFVINTASVNTNDPTGTRDPKLKEFFFEKLSSPQITGTFRNFDNGKANVEINMNGKSHDFSFPYTENGNELTMTGQVDILKDFGADNALSSIAEACKDLHANKTWSEVDIKATFKN